MIRDRLQYLKTFLVEKAEMLDVKIEVDIQMADVRSTEQRAQAWNEGKILENAFSEVNNLWIAMSEIDILADQFEYMDIREPCTCSKCAYYRSPLWEQEQSVGLTYDVLPPSEPYHWLEKWDEKEWYYLHTYLN